jgi:two-component system response regulator AtoC
MDKVMIVDDDRDLRGIVRDVLNDEGFQTLEAVDGVAAVKLFKTDRPDVVLLDLNMPLMKGMDTMQELTRIDRSVPVIILTGNGDISTAVEAIKAGAYDFTEKPPDFDKLILTLRRAIEKRALEMEVKKASCALESSLEHQLGKSNAMKTVIMQIKQVAQTDFAVIIQGETGTGKSVVASVIQNMSKRAGKPFVSVDIGLIPDLLVESELFGYRKGAFTGAERDKTGYFETAHHGTIFIDELENMSAHVQGKLLSFMEKKVIYPLGSTNPIGCDLRILAATNKDIRECVKRKEFRADLFYRLGEFIINIPPLRERIEDIPFFAKKFVFEASVELNKQIRGIADEAITLLMTHQWSGNLRELKNMMRKAALLTDSDAIGEACIKGLIMEQREDKGVSVSASLKEAMKELEKKMITEAMEKTGGNKTKAAELLEISYKNLFDKIKEYDIR